MLVFNAQPTVSLLLNQLLHPPPPPPPPPAPRTLLHRLPSTPTHTPTHCPSVQVMPNSYFFPISPPPPHLHHHRLVGLVVRRPPRERKTPGSNPACAGIFSGSSHTSDSKIGTPVTTLSGAWRCRVSTGTGRPGVSIL